MNHLRLLLSESLLKTIVLVGLAALLAVGTQADSFDSELNLAIKQLTEEAKTLDDLDDRSAKFSRPHPLVRNWKADQAAKVLSKIPDRFTGDPRRDAYVRYHLIYIVEKHFVEALTAWSETGKYEPDPNVVKRIESLTSTLPDNIEAEPRQPFTHVPEEIFDRYRELMSRTRVTIGFPPFQETFEGRAALERAEGNRKAEIEKILEQAEKLRGQFRRVNDPEAQKFNARIQEINKVLRDYRARVIFVLVQSGDSGNLKLVLQAVERQVAQGSRATFDLMEALYRAAFDGYLIAYDSDTIERFGRDLERLARANDVWKKYQRTDGGYWGPDYDFRNFAEVAFTLASLMQTPYKVNWLAKTAFMKVDPIEAGRLEQNHRADTITTGDIENAFARASNAINFPQSRYAEKLLPPTEPGARGQEAGDVPASMIDPFESQWGNLDKQERINRTGNHALAAWAQLRVGEHYLSPLVYRRLYWSLSRDTRETFDRSMRLQMMTYLPPTEFMPWIRRDAVSIQGSLSDKGNFPARWAGGPSTGWGDHATGQYGVLGLWAADQAGIEADKKRIELIDKHWRHTQDKSSGGWALAPLNVNVQNRAQGAEKVTAPMTAAGVATLTLTERFLYGKEMVAVDGKKVTEELRKGVNWLDKNFTLQTGGRDDATGLDWFYYMWTMQRVSQATGYQSFNNINLSRQVTAEILNRQRPDGLWSDESGLSSQMVSTCFAMLYLSNALQPSGIAKVRYDGPWDNRPHDIWNFTDYASDAFETPLTWQIVTPNEPLRELSESPILYLASDKTINLDNKAIENLRNYLYAGGMLILNPDGNDPGAKRSFMDLAKQILPDYEPIDLDREHLLNSILHQVNVPAKVVSNGIRPLIIMPTRDLSRALQEGDERDEAFQFMLNTYLYAVGRVTRRNRLDDQFLVMDSAKERGLRQIPVAQILLGPGDPEPMALPQLSAFMALNHRATLDTKSVKPEAISSGVRVAFLPVTEGVALNDAQAESLMNWVSGGGTLIIDAAGGGGPAGEALSEVLTKLAGGQGGAVIPSFDPIISGEGLGSTAHDNSYINFNRFTSFNRRVGNSPLIRAIDVDGRPGIIYSNEDLTATLAGVEHWGIQGYTVESARKIVANLILAATK
jgi:hypothetical protein